MYTYVVPVGYLYDLGSISMTWLHTGMYKSHKHENREEECSHPSNR